MPLIKTENRWLPITLTASEQEQAGKDLASKCMEIEDAETAESERRKGVKERMGFLLEERRTLVKLVQTGIRTGEVPVQLELNGESVTETRLDTGETMTRPAAELAQAARKELQQIIDEKETK